jgi:polysaccharide biosynthesis transport protein
MTENRNLPAPIRGPAPLEPAPYYDADPGSGETQDSTVMLRRTLKALLRYKWLIIGLLVVGTAGSLFAMRFVTYRYVAESTFWIDVPNRGDQMRGPIQSSGLLEDAAWSELLRTYAVLDYVVREQRLYLEHRPADARLFSTFRLDSLFRPGEYQFVVDATGTSADLRTKQGMQLQRVRAGEPVGKPAGFTWQPSAAEYTPKRKVSFRVLAPREASRHLARALNTRMPQGNNFMYLSYTNSDPQLAADVVNTVSARFVDMAAEQKRYRMAVLRDALEEQLVTSQVDLAQAEISLEGFRIQTITLPSDASMPVAPGLEMTRAPVMSAFFALKIEREMLQRDREALAAVLDGAPGDSLPVDALSVVGAVQQSPELKQALADLTAKRAELRAARQLYTDEHPVVRRAVEEVQVLERTVVPQLGRRVITSLDSRATVLDNTIASAGGELRGIPPRAIEEARLRRSVSIAENMYNDLRQRYESARLAAETSIPDVRVLDHAVVPTRPVSDPRIQVVLMGILGSLGLGILLSVLLDRADSRLRYAEQVTDGMRLAVIGAVPNLAGVRRGLLAGDESARVLESLRSIRLNLLHAHGSAGPVMVTVSSPGSGDGKTFISSNLALTFADLGMKTLIIDGDTRRGGLHHLYGTNRRPGLTDYLAGKAAIGDVVKSTKYPLVSVITGGTRRSDSPELLSSDRLGDLLAQIRTEYQAIIIDSPPLGAGIDPLVLGSLTGNMLLVMRTGRTDRAMAEAKLQMLDRLPIRLLGVILNGLDDGLSYKYYSYMPGYTPDPDEADSEQNLLQPV